MELPSSELVALSDCDLRSLLYARRLLNLEHELFHGTNHYTKFLAAFGAYVYTLCVLIRCFVRSISIWGAGFGVRGYTLLSLQIGECCSG